MRRIAVALLCSIAVTACTKSPQPSPQPSLTAAPSTPTVVPLTVADATKAALTLADLPKGWDGGVAVDPRPTPGTRAQYDPPECLVFRHPMDLLGKPSTAVLGQYFTRQPIQSVTEWVWSWPTRLDTVVPDLTGRFSKCSSYTMVATDRETYRWVAKQLRVGGLTDGIAFRFDTSRPADEVSLTAVYVAYVVRGGTVVHLEAQGDTITDAVFVQLVRKAVGRLDAVG